MFYARCAFAGRDAERAQRIAFRQPSRQNRGKGSGRGCAIDCQTLRGRSVVPRRKDQGLRRQTETGSGIVPVSQYRSIGIRGPHFAGERTTIRQRSVPSFHPRHVFDRSRRLPRAILNAIGWATGWKVTPYFSFTKAFVLALLKCKADPGSLPGLEAQRPKSPLVHLLNRPGMTAAGDLSVISGDIEGSS
jgi:hypothetical protein